MRARIVEADPIPLRWMIIRAGYRQSTLADVLGLSRQYLCEVAGGHRHANPELRERIAAALQLPERELFGDPDTYDNRFRTAETVTS